MILKLLHLWMNKHLTTSKVIIQKMMIMICSEQVMMMTFDATADLLSNHPEKRRSHAEMDDTFKMDVIDLD